MNDLITIFQYKFVSSLMCYIMTQVSEAKGEKSNDFSYLLLIFPSCHIRVNATTRGKSTPIAWSTVEVQGVDFSSGGRTILVVRTFSRSISSNNPREIDVYIHLDHDQFHDSLPLIDYNTWDQARTGSTMETLFNNRFLKQYV